MKKIKKEHFKDLDKLSKSNKGIEVCPKEFMKKFIDFDKLKNLLHYSKPPYSSDMIYFDRKNKIVWFVEFKSNNLNSLKQKKFEIRRKLLDGLIIFYELFGEKYCNYKKVFIVVYRNGLVDKVEENEKIYSYFNEELSLIYGDINKKEKEIKEHFALEEFEKNFFIVADIMKCFRFLSFFRDNSNIEQLDFLLRESG
jgi:hypothetical protein